MMDTVTVAATLVIRMTGLLLFVPDHGTDGRPTHILMPVSGSVPEHVAQVGYRSTTGAGCDYYRHQICYFDITGYSVTMPASSGMQAPAPLPAGALNLTNLVNRRVPRSYLTGTPPQNRVRGRVTLPSGQASGSCQLAGLSLGSQNLQMDQVVTWTATNVELPAGRLILERVPLGGGQPETIMNVPAAAGQRLELFVRHVPRSQQHHPGAGGGPALGDRVEHLHAFYDLLGVDPAPEARPIPRVVQTIGFPNACPWVEKKAGMGVEAMIPPSPTTVNCMVAGALPEA